LPLLLSLVDVAIDRQQPYGGRWTLEELRLVRDGIEYAVFALLEHMLEGLPGRNLYGELLDLLWRETGAPPTVLSLNYDLFADNEMIRASLRHGAAPAIEGRFPDYGCDVRTPAYSDRDERFGRLLKLHGSLNWLHCPNCHRLDIGVAQRGALSPLLTVKVLDELYQQSRLEDKYACTGSPCPECHASVRPVLITPTQRKDYRNPHIARVWYQAERALRFTDRVVVVGYSLPEDDLDVIYLLQRSLAHLDPARITVVEYDAPTYRSLGDHPVGARYKYLFGEVDWFSRGFEAWLDENPRLM
jgi:hypothetical protein